MLAASEAFASGKRGQLGRENTFLTEVGQRLLRRLVPVEGIFREQTLDECVDPRRDLGPMGRGQGNRLFRMGVVEKSNGIGAIGSSSRQHLERQHADRIEIGTRIESTRDEELGCHVLGRAHRRSRPGQLGEARHTRDAEIDELDPSVAIEHEVLGFQVTVYDTLSMAIPESREELRQNAPDERPLEGRARPNHLFQRVSIHELHDERETALALDEVVDGDDVLVVERTGYLELAPEPLDAHRVEAQVGVQQLDGNEGSRRELDRSVDSRRRPFADQLEVREPRHGWTSSRAETGGRH